MNFFDLHCHPSLKTFLGSDEENKRKNCWEEIHLSGIWEIVDTLIGDILDSQCSLDQMTKGKVQIATASLYSLEQPIVVGDIAKIKDTVINILLLSNFIPELSNKLLGEIAYDKTTYNQILYQIRTHLLNSEKLGKTYNLLNDFDQLDENKLNIILAIEGGHALFNNIHKYSDEEVLQNLKDLKTSPNRFLYLTLTHLTQAPLCTHAYGMKLMKDPMFLPNGYGISALGDKVIETALDNSDNKRIIIDIKHMSLQSRFMYYKTLESRKDTNGNKEDIPIIASHVAFTGVSYDEMPIISYKDSGKQILVNYYKPKGLMNTEFNPWSINLYNEEIPIIIKSNGLFGIILDERVLGCKLDVKEEYFSKEEFVHYQEKAKANRKKFQKLEKKWEKQKFEEEVGDLMIFNKQLRHLANNILHTVRIGGEKAWKHICLGTDFDGLIDAIHPCKTVDKLPNLHQKLVRILPKMAKTDPLNNYFIDDDNAEDRVNDIMYNNGVDFLKRYYSTTYKETAKELKTKKS